MFDSHLQYLGYDYNCSRGLSQQLTLFSSVFICAATIDFLDIFSPGHKSLLCSFSHSLRWLDSSKNKVLHWGELPLRHIYRNSCQISVIVPNIDFPLKFCLYVCRKSSVFFVIFVIFALVNVDSVSDTGHCECISLLIESGARRECDPFISC